MYATMAAQSRAVGSMRIIPPENSRPWCPRTPARSTASDTQVIGNGHAGLVAARGQIVVAADTWPWAGGLEVRFEGGSGVCGLACL
jgi:hypothetical protein